MAEINQNYTEQAHEQEYQPENQQELANELAHAQEHEEENHEVEGGIPENFHPEGEPNPADEQNNADELNNADEQNNADEPDNADELNYADELNHADEPNNADETNNAQKPVSGSGDRWPGWPGESVFRILVPAQKVGGIIGRKGEYIKKTCEETKARIKILDGPPGMRERAVMISAKEEPDAPLPPAVGGLLRVHKRAVDGLENDSSLPPPVSGGKVSTRLLVPAAQAGSLIGKQGTTVKSIQEESNCVVRILEDLPVFALQDDRIVEVVGEPASTHKAVELIASHLRKFLVDRSIIPIIEMQMQMPNAQMEHMPPPQQWGPPPPQSFPQNGPVGPGYGASPHFMPPPRQFDNYYPPPAEIPPPSEKQPHQGISAYGREAQLPVHSSASQPTSSVITQMTQQMQIPLLYADAVIGTQGSSISYIRRVSGATVTIQETRGVPTEMTVEISGTSSQVQTAQQLIQNFMAEAAASAAPQTQHASSGEQAYSSYAASQGSVYAASQPPSNPAGQTGGGAYGSVYGSNYGY